MKPITCEDAQIINMTIGRKIMFRRNQLRLTRAKLADMINIHESCISKYERGDFNISAYRLKQLAEALIVDINYFFIGEESNDGNGTQYSEFTKAGFFD